MKRAAGRVKKTKSAPDLVEGTEKLTHTAWLPSQAKSLASSCKNMTGRFVSLRRSRSAW